MVSGGESEGRMTEDEKPLFKRLILATFKTYGAMTPDNDTLKIWWNSLNRYNSVHVRAAFDRHINTSRFTPRISEIREILENQWPLETAKSLPAPPSMTVEERKAGAKRLHEMAAALWKKKEIT
jgi:hypothetical protein